MLSVDGTVHTFEQQPENAIQNIDANLHRRQVQAQNLPLCQQADESNSSKQKSVYDASSGTTHSLGVWCCTTIICIGSIAAASQMGRPTQNVIQHMSSDLSHMSSTFKVRSAKLTLSFSFTHFSRRAARTRTTYCQPAIARGSVIETVDTLNNIR